MTELDNKPFYMDIAGASPLGETVDMHFKCTLFDDGNVLWELRRLCDTYGFTNSQAVKYFRTEKLTKLVSAMRKLDIPTGFMLVPSLRALQGGPAPYGVKPYILDEFTICSRGLLYAMILIKGINLKGDHIDRARASLRLFLERLLPVGFLDVMPHYPQLLPIEGVECNLPAADGEHECGHFKQLRAEQTALSQSQSCPQAAFAMLLQRFWGNDDCSCIHMGSWLDGVVHDLVDLIKKNLGMNCHSNPLEQANLQVNGKKSRRIDQHLRQSAADLIRSENLAGNSQQWARATGKVNPKSMSYIRDQSLVAIPRPTSTPPT
jgi:hypothetical protein